MITYSRIVFAMLAVICLLNNAYSQTFPMRSIRIIVPFPAGGGADIMARIIAPSLSESLGQPVVVENRGGGGTLIGTELVAKSIPDGHTILIVYPSFVIAPALRGITTVDPIKDFRAVGQTISLPMGIAVHPSVPAKSIRELVQLARSKPGEITYGAGAGTLHYVIGEMLRLATNIKVTPIPYQGSSQIFPALAGGHISMVVSNVAEIAPFATIGKIRAIVVTTPNRAELLPAVQTMREAGYPELESTNWGGIVVRVNTPEVAVTRLNAELVRVLRNPAIAEKLKAQSMNASPGTPQQFSALLQSEFSRYFKVIRDAGIKAD